MNNSWFNKAERQKQLLQRLDEDPFVTDEELAQALGVSVQTIRLDRLALGIPELRVRVRDLATSAYQRVRSLQKGELIGELVDLNLGVSGISLLEVTREMVLEKSGVARGHYLFAQANSLAVAIIDASSVLTGSARVRFKRPVFLGERVFAKAIVKVKKASSFLVSVQSRVKNDLVFKGHFIVVAMAEKGLGGGNYAHSS